METLTERKRKFDILNKINYTVLFAYSVLFILTQSVIYRNYMDEMITMEYLLGLGLAILTMIRFFQLSRDGKVDWLRLRIATFLYFAVRIITLFLWGFEASTRKTGFFEGVYLLALSELTVDLKLVKKIILPTLLITNLVFNVLNIAAQLIFSVDDGNPVRFLHFFNAIKEPLYKYPDLFYKNVNTIGTVTAFCILIAIALYKEREKPSTLMRIGFIVYLAFQGYCLYYSQSRASILSFLVCLIVLVVNSKLGISPKKLLLSFFAVMLAIIIAIIGFIVVHASTGLSYYEGSVYSNEMTDLEKKIDNLSSSRYSIWKNSYYVMSDPKKLLLGSGNIEREHFNRDDYKREMYYVTTGDTSSYSPNTYSHTHNGYFTMLTCTGLLGSIFFAITIKKRIDHSVILEDGIWYIIFCYAAILNQFEVVTILHKRTIAYILMLILSISMYNKGQRKNEQKHLGN